MASEEELANFRRYLVAYGGGYLRNTLWESPATCPHCSGIAGNPDFVTCYPCQRTYDPGGETSDARGFVSYGWNNSQSSRVMYGYKEAIPNQSAQRLVSVLLFYALHEHLACATHPVHGPPTMWATVPSLRQRGHPQALHTISAQLLRTMPEAVISANDDVADPRSFRPENFTVRTDVRGRHVLLIEDTWTSGAHAESAAAALRRAGASCVTLLVLARWLDLGRGNTDEFVRNELVADFDPSLCPFGHNCHG